MNSFSSLFKYAVTSRHVELVPLLDIELPDGAVGYMSDRRVLVDEIDGPGTPSRIYVRKLLEWNGIQQDIDGSASSATFILSNVDRVLEAAHRDHPFFRGKVTFSLHVDVHGSYEDTTRVVWKGYITETSYDAKEFTITCKDGFFALTLPSPRKRATRNCSNQFDDGCYCPYSGYGYKGAGIPPFDENGVGELIQISEKVGVVGPSGETYSSGTKVTGRLGSDESDTDFGPDIDTANADLNKREGYAFRLTNEEGDVLATGAGYTSCDKTFGDCYKRGMTRFFGGLRYVASWSISQDGRRFGIFRSPNFSISTSNDSIFNQVYPMVYCNVEQLGNSPLTPDETHLHGLIHTPVLYQWRPEQQFYAAEFMIGLGRVGVPDKDMKNEEFKAIRDIYINGKGPHGIERKNIPPDTPQQFPDPLDERTWGFGSSRSAGRIGEPLAWDEIGGDLVNADAWINPITLEQETPPGPLTFSRMAGGMGRIFDLEAGNNSPQSGSNSGSDSTKNSSAGAPDVKIAFDYGRWVWQYTEADEDRTYGPTSNPAWILLDLILDSLDTRYNKTEFSEEFFDVESFRNLADYCFEAVTNIVNPEIEAPRYVWCGAINDAKPAVDHLDNILRDVYGYRFYRNGKIAVAPYTACQFDTLPRPGFQEFVNISYGEDESFTVKQVQPKHNELQLSFGDIDFDFQKNTATLYSEAHQLLIGQDGNRYQMTQSQTLAGTPTTDQATRIGIRMLKDELGGTDVIDWRMQHDIELKAPFFMTELEVGDVTYVANTLLPTGGGWYRVTSWQLNKDYTVDYKLRTFNIGNYDDLPSGASSVSLAGFGYNPYIPGSGGLALRSLPPLQWDDALPIASYPNVGVKLKWQNYADPPYEDYKALNSRKLAVQIYRTPAVTLKLDVDEEETEWTVMNGDLFKHDLFINLPTPALIEQEEILVTGFDLLTDPYNQTMTVERAQNGTLAHSHVAGTKAAKILYLGGFLAAHTSAIATTWIVGEFPFDFKVGEKYLVDAELIKVTSIIEHVDPEDPWEITVARAQRVNDNDESEIPTAAQPHAKMRPIISIYYLDKIPGSLTRQGFTLTDTEYIDPWVPSSAQKMRVRSFGDSTVVGALTVTP